MRGVQRHAQGMKLLPLLSIANSHLPPPEKRYTHLKLICLLDILPFELHCFLLMKYEIKVFDKKIHVIWRINKRGFGSAALQFIEPT